MNKHYDIVGNEITQGSFVACQIYWRRQMEIGMVVKLTPKMIRVRRLVGNRWGNYYSCCRYPNEVILINNSEDITMYILQQGQKRESII
jgi:hypothetical protein